MLFIFCLSSVCNAEVDIRGEFERFSPGYNKNRKKLKKSLKKYLKAIQKKEKKGEATICVKQVYNEAKWFISYTALLGEAQKRLNRIEKLLAGQEKDSFKDEQSPVDGSWGRCYELWFLKLDVTSNHIGDLHHQKKLPKYAVKLLDKINGPALLKAELNRILISDIRKDGVFHRKELNLVVSALLRLITRSRPSNYSYHPKLKKTLLDFINPSWQDEETGFWGAWIKSGDKLEKLGDLSITFHIVSYLKGKVPRLGRIAWNTYQIRDDPYPLGLIEEGTYMNHHNYDAVRLFSYGWPTLDVNKRKLISSEINKMLNWCLASSLRSDGSFPLTPSEDSPAEAYYFGVSFLNETGFFQKSKRFWTEKEFPQSAKIKKLILKQLHKLESSELFVRDTIKILNK